MSVEKHNNNFFLYAIGSAFMLVSGAVLVSSSFFDVSFSAERQSASVVQYQSLTVQESVTISGNISELRDTEVWNISGMEVLLFSGQTDEEFELDQKTYTNQAGDYQFSVDSSGDYRVVVPWTLDFEITLPQTSLSGFDARQTSQDVVVRQGKDVSGVDFIGAVRD